MSLILPKGTIRWKDWIPLITQQQRLRNLIQVIAYNINQDANLEGKWRKGTRYFYTLHLTTMSSPFYTSEKLDSENPKWSEVEINNPSYGTATGVVIRVWQNYNNEDKEVTVWGVCFSGLVYIGSQLSQTNPGAFSSNTIVFYMRGGYFTDPKCFKGKSPLVLRLTSASISPQYVKQSYSVELFLKIHRFQHEIKKQFEIAENLRKQILMGGNQQSRTEIREASSTLRKLLNQSKPPKLPYSEVIAVQKNIEVVKFRVQLLSQEKSRKLAEIRRLSSIKCTLYENNQDKGCELMERYRELKRDVECMKQWRQQCEDTQTALSQAFSQLSIRRKQLINQLSIIYPITQISEGKLAICGIHLPNSEDFKGHDEVMIAVALGYVARLVQLIAYFLHIPSRYPIIHYGSRSKIMDHISADMADKDRQFPLFLRGKDRLQFDYAVYLLNKNISQLRWFCGIPTSDLRTTLPNLAALLHDKLGNCVPEMLKRPLFRYPLEIPSSPSSSRPTPSHYSLNSFKSSSISYSLDKGLDRWAESKRECSEESCSLSHVSQVLYSSSYEEKYRSVTQEKFLEAWQGDQVACSDEELKKNSLTIVQNDVSNSPISNFSNNSVSNVYNDFPVLSTLYDSLPNFTATPSISLPQDKSNEPNLNFNVHNSDNLLEKKESNVSGKNFNPGIDFQLESGPDNLKLTNNDINYEPNLTATNDSISSQD